MSHELTIRRDGKVEMAYTGEQPWHGLGTKLPQEAALDEWIPAAGMDWDVVPAPIFYETEALGQVKIPDRLVMHRSDTGAPLGVVSSNYKIVQPRQTIEFFRDLIEGMGLRMETAGTLFGGRKFWALGYIGEDAVVDSQDMVRGYLLLSSSADGSAATDGRFTSIRVVCRNTLQMAMDTETKRGMRVVHSTTFDEKMMKKALGVAPRTFENFMSRMRTFASQSLSVGDAQELTSRLVKREIEDDGIAGTVGDRIMALFGGEAIGSGLAGTEGTAWGWLNAVSQFADHERRAKTDSHRLNTALFGSGDRMKNRALELVSAD